MSKPKGFEEVCFDKQTGTLVTKRIEYKLVERDGKTFAEPIGKEQGNIGIGDSMLTINTWWPSEHIQCGGCGVYGMVHTIHIGEYACANCGRKEIHDPETKLHVTTNAE